VLQALHNYEGGLESFNGSKALQQCSGLLLITLRAQTLGNIVSQQPVTLIDLQDQPKRNGVLLRAFPFTHSAGVQSSCKMKVLQNASSNCGAYI
jgi:hypothetical protein